MRIEIKEFVPIIPVPGNGVRMVDLSVLIHATIGEIGLFAYLCVLFELLNPNETRIRRAI